MIESSLSDKKTHKISLCGSTFNSFLLLNTLSGRLAGSYVLVQVNIKAHRVKLGYCKNSVVTSLYNV